MVLALPLLLFIMALMINFGVVASWKVRGLSVARHVLWGSRWPRSGSGNPRPAYWPETAGVGTGGPAHVAELDDPRLDQPVARGPLPLGTEVRAELLDPTRGLRRGSAEIRRAFPLLARMGDYHLTARTCLLDDKWQYQRMGMGHNRQRRIPVIYALAKAPPGLVDAYVQAVVAILYAPFRPQLAPLDRDDEFIQYGRRFGWGGGAPDFHPRLRRFCSLDLLLAAQRVEDLIDRIQGEVQRDEDGNVTRRIPCVAEKMTRAFINLYERVIQELQRQISASPPPPAGQLASIQAEIDQLEAKIDVLSQFLETLQDTNGN